MFKFNLRQLFLDADEEQSGCVSEIAQSAGGDILSAFLLRRDYGEMCCGQIKPSAPWSCNSAPETSPLRVLPLVCTQRPCLMQKLRLVNNAVE